MPAFSSSGREDRHRPLDVRLAVAAPRVEVRGELAVALRVEGLEGEVLQLPLHLPDPEPLGERRVDLHRLAGDPLLLLGRQAAERPHVVEPVGELDEDDPDVLGHRQEHLADVLGLPLLVGVGGELRELRHAVDELGHLRPEALLDVGEAVLRVLGHVVEEGGRDGGRVEAELGERQGGRDRVRDVGLAGRPQLALVGDDREVEGAADRRRVGAGRVGGDRGEQLAAQDRAAGGRRRVRGARRGAPAASPPAVRPAWVRRRGAARATSVRRG